MEAIGHKGVEWHNLRKIIMCGKVWVMEREMGDQSTERGDAIALANPQHGHIQAIRARLQGGCSIGDGAAQVIMPMKLDANLGIAFRTETNKLFHPAWRSYANGIR